MNIYEYIITVMSAIQVVRSIAVSLISIGILTVNPVTLLGIWRTLSVRKEILTPVTFSVFLADFVQGLFLGPISTYLSWGNVINPPEWLVRIHSFYLAGTLANVGSVMLLSLCQTIAIVTPLRFSSLVTKRRVWIGLTFTWVWSFIVAVFRTCSNGIKYNIPTR